MNVKLNSLLTVAASALLAGTIIVGCKDTGYPEPQPTSAAPNTSARVQFVNATGDATALSAFLENNPVGTVLAQGQTTNYVNVPFLGLLQLRIKGAGGTLGPADVSIKSTVVLNGAYTAFVTDSINRPVVRNAANIVTDPGGARIVVVTDPLTQTLTPGAGGVRFFHLAPDVGVVSLRLLPTSPASVTAAANLNNRTYRTVTANAFTSVPAATYIAQVFSGTAVPPLSSTIAPVLSVSGVTVEATKLYTLYAQGLARRRTLSVGRIQHN